MKRLLLLLLFFSTTYSVLASHGQNARITYKCVGANTYEITLEVYRDCNGINLVNSQTISYSASCASSSFQVFRVSQEDVTPQCVTQQSACNGGNGSFGTEKHTYRGTLILPPGCATVQLDYRLCCRSLSLTSISDPNGEDLYVRAIFDASLSVCNNSPVFNNETVIYPASNQFQSYIRNA